MQSLENLFEEYIAFQREGMKDFKLGEPIKPMSKERRRRQKNLESMILGHPDSFERVRCWMVDVRGSRVNLLATDDERKTELHKLMDDFIENGSGAVARISQLADEVLTFMRGIATVTDSGAGSDDWHLGAMCTYAEAKRLCAALYEKYAMEIEKGILRVERMPWSLSMK